MKFAAETKTSKKPGKSAASKPIIPTTSRRAQARDPSSSSMAPGSSISKNAPGTKVVPGVCKVEKPRSRKHVC